MLIKIPNRLRKTEFYGKMALVIGDHFHSGKTVRCVGAFKWVRKWYMVFEDEKTKLRFTVDKPSNITWIEKKKDDEKEN